MEEQQISPTTSAGVEAVLPTAIQGAEPETAVPVESKRPPVVFFNAVVHEIVQRLHNKGIWYDMGPRYGGLLWRIRPFSHPSVVAKAEFVEKTVRLREKLDDKDEISGEHRMEINRAAILMATTGVKGLVNVGDPNMVTQDPTLLSLVESAKLVLAAAQRHRYQITQSDGLVLVTFNGTETEKPLRDVIEPILASSVSMLNQLFRASNNLQKVKDQEIYALGEAYVYGRTEGYDWAD
jgi:hypothetical protein